MAKLVLATHGHLSAGMADSLKMIVGAQADALEVYSLKPGENPEDYALKKRREIEASHETHVFIADIKGGSVHTALMQLSDLDHVFVISGMNMPLVLELLFTLRDDISADDIEAVIKEARNGITLSKLEKRNDEEEDF